jgi:hypothetical protein
VISDVFLPTADPIHHQPDAAGRRRHLHRCDARNRCTQG